MEMDNRRTVLPSEDIQAQRTEVATLQHIVLKKRRLQEEACAILHHLLAMPAAQSHEDPLMCVLLCYLYVSLKLLS
jgi:hypothetical protein